MLDIKEKLSLVPNKPGVYLFKDKKGEIIYIGKAISLKNRVRQYFQSLKNQATKVQAMVRNIATFEYIVTDNELEALILECNLIKENRPKYNILLRDDKTYPYIKITLGEDYPRVIKTREFRRDGSKYFGPYTNVSALNETLQLIRELFPIRTCKRNIANSIEKGERPCLNFHIGKCLGPCTGNIKREEYMEIIQEILLFLQGKEDELIKKIEREMEEASQRLNFEKAARCRDQLKALNSMVEKQKVVVNEDIDQDIMAAAQDVGESCVQVFHIRGGKLIQRQQYFLAVEEDVSIGEILTSFVKQFYNNMTFIPKEILVEEELMDMDLMESWLSKKRGNRVYIRSPKIGEKKHLMNMVKKNAVLMIEQRREINRRKEEKTNRLMGEFQELLDLPSPPGRIEAFDISNIQGVESVGSMVVFQDGLPSYRDYRRFKIRTIGGIDDYASMGEVISRRFKRGLAETRDLIEGKSSIKEGKFSVFPDLIMVDGGLGQVNRAEEILRELEVSIPVCGMVKDDRHRTRGLIYGGVEINIKERAGIFAFIGKVQDEAHRFAINYHRSLRRAKNLTSILEEIPGVGPKRRRALLKHFKGINKIKEATPEELMKVEGLNKKLAENIFSYFQNKK